MPPSARYAVSVLKITRLEKGRAAGGSSNPWPAAAPTGPQTSGTCCGFTTPGRLAERPSTDRATWCGWPVGTCRTAWCAGPNPRVILYGFDQAVRGLGMSYPDFIEQDGRLWITTTDKEDARIFEIDPKLLAGLWDR